MHNFSYMFKLLAKAYIALAKLVIYSFRYIGINQLTDITVTN